MSGAQKRLAKLEARNTPGIPQEAMIIDRRPGESNERALERFWAEQPENWNAQAPRIYLCLNREVPA